MRVWSQLMSVIGYVDADGGETEDIPLISGRQWSRSKFRRVIMSGSCLLIANNTSYEITEYAQRLPVGNRVKTISIKTFSETLL